MHEFVRRFRSNLHTVPLRMNCCVSVKQIEDNVGSTRLTLPGGIEIWIRYPHCMDVCEEEPCGEAYLSDYDVWSPELPAEELADWVETQLDCCRRIDEYCEKHSHELHPLNSAMQADLAARIKNVWRMAQAAVDLPKGFHYTGFRSEEDWVKSTLVYTSPKSGAFTWLLKSGLGLEPDSTGNGIDGWAFQPDFRPISESIHKIRPGYSIDMGTELYVQQVSGADEQARDKKAAYWLVGILNDIVDKAIESPPPRCYPVLLADHVTNLKKSDLDTMTLQGVISLLNAGVLTGEQVLKGKPELFKKLLQKGAVSGEMVARRLPEQVFWLAKNKYISPDYAIKLQPGLKDKLLKAGLYSETDLSGYTPEQILAGVKDGTITPVDAYRANPKLLQNMVENQLITPQEAYKLDAAIVTWLLLNHYIGRAEAKRVKSDIERYVQQKHKDVDWESLDAARNPNPDMIRSEGGQVTSIVKGKITQKNLEKALIAAVKAEDDIDDANAKILAKAQKIRDAAGLSSSKANPKRAPRQLKINSSTSVRAQLTDSRVIDGTHYFCVEGPGVGDNIQYMNQLQTYLPGYTVSSSGYNDRLYVAAPEEAKDVVDIAVQHFNRDLVSDLNSCDTGATQVGDIAQTTTIPGKKSINSDLTDVNREINEEMHAESQAALSPLTELDKAKSEGPAWKVTIKYPGDLLSDYTTWILIPAVDKADAQVKFNEKMGKDATIISWDEQVNSLDEYREKYPLSNVRVLE